MTNFSSATPEDSKYLDIILSNIRVCAAYKPKFGQGRRKGLTFREFQGLYQDDLFYSWFGLDNPMMYAAHKVAGGITSVYRQIGIGCEKLFRQLLQDNLGLYDEDAKWSYETTTLDGKTRKLSLDGRVPLESITNSAAKVRFLDWMKQSADVVGVEPRVFNSLTGTVFEIRQGYKSKDSKRQNADIANASAAYIKSYLPCVAVFSNQIDDDVLRRYRAEKWAVITGVAGRNNPLISTYDFMRDIIGYDLAGFFGRNAEILRTEIDKTLKVLLEPNPQ